MQAVRMARKGHRVTSGHKVQPVRKVRLARKVTQAHKVQLVLKVLRVQPARPVPTG